MRANKTWRDLATFSGFSFVAYNRGSWTEYHASQINADGYIINGRSFSSCYKRDAAAKISEWVKQDKEKAAQSAS